MKQWTYVIYNKGIIKFIHTNEMEYQLILGMKISGLVSWYFHVINFKTWGPGFYHYEYGKLIVKSRLSVALQ